MVAIARKDLWSQDHTYKWDEGYAKEECHHATNFSNKLKTVFALFLCLKTRMNQCYLNEWLRTVLYRCKIHTGHRKPERDISKHMLIKILTSERWHWELHWRWGSPWDFASLSRTGWISSEKLRTWGLCVKERTNCTVIWDTKKQKCSHLRDWQLEGHSSSYLSLKSWSSSLPPFFIPEARVADLEGVHLEDVFGARKEQDWSPDPATSIFPIRQFSFL